MINVRDFELFMRVSKALSRVDDPEANRAAAEMLDRLRDRSNTIEDQSDEIERLRKQVA